MRAIFVVAAIRNVLVAHQLRVRVAAHVRPEVRAQRVARLLVDVSPAAVARTVAAPRWSEPFSRRSRTLTGRTGSTVPVAQN